MSICFWNRFLRIDLTSQKVEEFSLDNDLFRKYLGGSGLAAYLLEQELDTDVDPLQPENPLAVFTGLLNGTPVPAAGRTSICSRSPLTGIWAESTCGGKFGNALKSTGHDGLIITGRSPKPVVLYLENEKVQFIDAADLWGMNTYDTENKLQETLPGTQTICIGPAGEKMVRFASVIAEGRHARAAGRCGMGAVMGSKNLKAIAVKGTQKVELADRKGLMDYLKNEIKNIKEKAAALTKFGTAGGVMAVEANGDLPIKNWTLGDWAEGAAKTCGQEIDRLYLERHSSCPGCPIRCAKLVKLPSGPAKGEVVHGPEYETCAGFGGLLLNDDLETIVLAQDLCNRLGVDVISTASAIALAMELWERDLIGPDDTQGLKLEWGSKEAILTMIEKIALKDGFGEIFKDGNEEAAKKIGGTAPEFVVTSKGLDIAFHDPRAFTGMAANYATANRGGCHLEALTYFGESGAFPLSLVGYDREFHPHGTENKSELAILMQNFLSVFNPLGLCKFLIRGAVGPEQISGWVRTTLGWDFDTKELMETGERIFNLKRKYNVKLGISRKDDKLPPRLLVHDRKTGRAAGSLPHIGRLLADYYELRGWSEEGIPKESTLMRLGLKG